MYIIGHILFNFTVFFFRNGQISMDMTLKNKAMQPMSGFAIQLNKNS